MNKIFSEDTASVVKNPSRLFRRWFWSQLKSDICAFFNPRQKWLTKVISNHWQDKDYLIPACLFECLVNYVEDENGFAHIDQDWTDEIKFVHQEYVDRVQGNDRKVLELYKYIKEERPKLQKEVDEALYKPYDGSYLELENEFYEKDTLALVEIVKLRGYLWT